MDIFYSLVPVVFLLLVEWLSKYSSFNIRTGILVGLVAGVAAFYMIKFIPPFFEGGTDYQFLSGVSDIFVLSACVVLGPLFGCGHHIKEYLDNA